MELEHETTKPQSIKSKEQFEKMASEMLAGWKEYKKIENRMKLLDASTKKYMLDNDMDEYRCDGGKITIIEQSRKVLDRALIDDIEKYKVDTSVKMSFKCPM